MIVTGIALGQALSDAEDLQWAQVEGTVTFASEQADGMTLDLNSGTGRIHVDLASHAGWSEFSSYSGNRKAWDDADASAKLKGTTAASEFTMSGSGTVYGVFVCAVASGTSGVLWSTAGFDTTAAVVTSDVLRISYGLRT